MSEEPVPYGDTHKKIADVCSETLKTVGAANPTLFDRTTAALLAAGVNVDQDTTQQGRGQSPNLVAVFRPMPGEDYLEYIQLEGEQFTVYAYDGEPLTNLLAETDALNVCDPPLQPSDLAQLRHLIRDGVKFYDEDDVWLIVEKKQAEKETKRAELTVMTLELPEEFLDLCEDVKTSPATILRGFIADLCNLRSGEYNTNGSDERDLAEQYFARCGYRFMARDE